MLASEFETSPEGLAGLMSVRRVSALFVSRSSIQGVFSLCLLIDSLCFGIMIE